MPEAQVARGSAPEPGQLVQVRRRWWIVRDVHPGAIDPVKCPHRRVTLESVDPDSHGDVLQVIWEREVHTRVQEALDLPTPTGNWDPLKRFEAFVLATRWSAASALDALPLQAPFRGAVCPEEYQLEAVVRALAMPRVNLLIADFVGAGKTIEAGMVLQEMIARQRARKILIVCPASLQLQWAEEMEEKFALHFEVVDREYIQLLRREYGIHVNPWTGHPRLITSMDFLKRDEPLNLFLSAFKTRREGLLRAWDLLIVDEAHNTAPASPSSRTRDSARTAMLRQIINHFEHRLFLTATPHNGYTQSFTGLLEMLDPLRFSWGPIRDKESFAKHRDAVMVRRIKEDIVDDLGEPVFPRRVIDPPLEVTLSKGEQNLVALLDQYLVSLHGSPMAKGRRMAVNFVLELLKKRLLSSPKAFKESIHLHQSHLRPADEAEATPKDEKVVQEYRHRLEEEFSDDSAREETEVAATAEATAFFEANPEQVSLVEEMCQAADDLAEKPDTKAHVLLEWIEKHLRDGEKWGRDRLVIFTEYRHTLDYLGGIFDGLGWTDHVLTFTGGLTLGERQDVKNAFQTDPDESQVRILLATDAASEGLNLQNHCRYLIHYEIPWNPNRMEQRDGRIDRHGQPAKKVFCHHFRFTNNEDQRFLDVIVDKVKNQRDDLGAVSPVIAKGVTDCLLREANSVPADAAQRARQEEDLRSLKGAEDIREVTRKRLRELREKLAQARETWQLCPANMVKVLNEALRMEGSTGLTLVNEGVLTDRAYDLKDVPPGWNDIRRSIQNNKGQRLKLVFAQDLKRDDPIYKRKDVALLHLDHPLLVRALRVFRSRLWSQGLEKNEAPLSRISYKVLPDAQVSAIHIISIVRIVARNSAGHRVHEELVPVGGAIREKEIETADDATLRKLWTASGTYPAIATELGDRLRALFPAHKLRLDPLMKAVERQHAQAIGKKLADAGKTEAKEIRGLIGERIKEIEARLEKAGVETGPKQLEFEFIDAEQLEQNLRWLERRLEALRKERETAPEEAKGRYQVGKDGVRAFPVGLLYVLPASTKGIQGTREKNGIVSHVDLYNHLRHLELCLRKAITLAHPREEWTACLPPQRLKKARELQRDKEKHRPGVGLIECLNLADFLRIIAKSPEVRKRCGLGEATKAVKKKLGALETIRNRVAHHEDLARTAEDLEKVEEARSVLIDLLETVDAALGQEGEA